MKRQGLGILIVVALIVCGLETGCSTPAKQQQQTNLAASSLVGDWTGTLTGTNFGTTPLNLSFYICPANSGNCGTKVLFLQSWILGEDENWVVGGSNCGETGEQLWQGTLGSSGPITINGSQLSVSYSGNTGPGQGNIPWTFSINGTVAANQSMSGNISFSFPPCGTAVAPWTGTFTATLQP